LKFKILQDDNENNGGYTEFFHGDVHTG